MIDQAGLQVAPALSQFIEDEALPGTGIDKAAFWSGFGAGARARAATANCSRSASACSELDAWHRAHPGPVRDHAAYRAFLERIGYLVPVPSNVAAATANVDSEIATQAGPQLVVPLSNARYALNAANARWGLYDALYGTDAEDGGAERTTAYNPTRGRA
jgi:malate synthase